jgi:hypothetical protein
MKRTWDESGTCSIEVVLEEGELWDIATEKPIPAFLVPFLGDALDAEIIIDFRAKGYYEPASMYGGPDNLGWPAEGDEERLLDEVYLKVDDKKINLPEEIQQKVFDHYEDEIENEEIDHG